MRTIPLIPMSTGSQCRAENPVLALNTHAHRNAHRPGPLDFQHDIIRLVHYMQTQTKAELYKVMQMECFDIFVASEFDSEIFSWLARSLFKFI